MLSSLSSCFGSRRCKRPASRDPHEDNKQVQAATHCPAHSSDAQCEGESDAAGWALSMLPACHDLLFISDMQGRLQYLNGRRLPEHEGPEHIACFLSPDQLQSCQKAVSSGKTWEGVARFDASVLKLPSTPPHGPGAASQPQAVAHAPTLPHTPLIQHSLYMHACDSSSTVSLPMPRSRWSAAGAGVAGLDRGDGGVSSRHRYRSLDLPRNLSGSVPQHVHSSNAFVLVSQPEVSASSSMQLPSATSHRKLQSLLQVSLTRDKADSVSSTGHATPRRSDSVTNPTVTSLASLGQCAEMRELLAGGRRPDRDCGEWAAVDSGMRLSGDNVLRAGMAYSQVATSSCHTCHPASTPQQQPLMRMSPPLAQGCAPTSGEQASGMGQHMLPSSSASLAAAARSRLSAKLPPGSHTSPTVPVDSASLGALARTSSLGGCPELLGGISGGGGGGEVQRVWEVRVSPIAHHASGEHALLVALHDCTQHAQVEQLLCDLTESQISIVASILPKHVMQHLTCRTRGQRGGMDAATLNAMARTHDDVTLLFMDIVQFTTMSKQVAPQQVMQFLNTLFSLFDHLVAVHGVHKVETAGDCYIVSGGIAQVDEDGFLRVLEGGHDPATSAAAVMAFAKDMLAAAATVAMPHNCEPVQIRIGLHTGPVVTGVIGSALPKFSVFGDTMNTASRMESTSVPGRIHVSEATHALLPHEAWQPTGGVEVKGKGMMMTYLWVPHMPVHTDRSSLDDQSISLHLPQTRDSTNPELSADVNWCVAGHEGVIASFTPYKELDIMVTTGASATSNGLQDAGFQACLEAASPLMTVPISPVRSGAAVAATLSKTNPAPVRSLTSLMKAAAAVQEMRASTSGRAAPRQAVLPTLARLMAASRSAGDSQSSATGTDAAFTNDHAQANDKAQGHGKGHAAQEDSMPQLAAAAGTALARIAADRMSVQGRTSRLLRGTGSGSTGDKAVDRLSAPCTSAQACTCEA